MMDEFSCFFCLYIILTEAVLAVSSCEPPGSEGKSLPCALHHKTILQFPVNYHINWIAAAHGKYQCLASRENCVEFGRKREKPLLLPGTLPQPAPKVSGKHLHLVFMGFPRLCTHSNSESTDCSEKSTCETCRKWLAVLAPSSKTQGPLPHETSYLPGSYCPRRLLDCSLNFKSLASLFLLAEPQKEKSSYQEERIESLLAKLDETKVTTHVISHMLPDVSIMALSTKSF